MGEYEVPCGRTTGHGESCAQGSLCDACKEIMRLRLHRDVFEQVKAALRVPAMMSYVGWAQECRDAHDVLAKANTEIIRTRCELEKEQRLRREVEEQLASMTLDNAAKGAALKHASRSLHYETSAEEEQSIRDEVDAARSSTPAPEVLSAVSLALDNARLKATLKNLMNRCEDMEHSLVHSEGTKLFAASIAGTLRSALSSTPDALVQEVRDVFGALLKSHAWFTAREYDRDTTYNNQSVGYKEEEAALKLFKKLFGFDVLLAKLE